MHFSRPVTSNCVKNERGSLRINARDLEHPWNKALKLWRDFQQLPGIEESNHQDLWSGDGIEPHTLTIILCVSRQRSLHRIIYFLTLTFSRDF